MNWGLSDQTIGAISEVLGRHVDVDQAVLYGSRAKGDYKPGSDIDLTLLGDELDWRRCMAIADELDELLLPYQIDLSVLPLLTDVGLRAHIARVGVVFYRRNPTESENR